ncbi:MAG TPA: acetylxylan esterase [Gemmataceae bacterium]|jgi:cephalosporin-C deacetylase-like acetyl esterase
MTQLRRSVFAIILLLTALASSAAAQSKAAGLAEQLRRLDSHVLPKNDDPSRRPDGMLGRSIRARLRAANDRESDAWRALRTKADWEKYRDARIRALRQSLGSFPPVPSDLQVRIARTIRTEKYRIDNIVFVSRPGLVVTANLYAPEPAAKAMPGILICHSHHNPKTQGELQDMGILWAQAGCLVLVMDQLGHGERRQHPFVDAASYPKPFRAGRQDYYFRYNTGLQLHAIGDSLIGWMVWDLMRGVDVLLSRPGIDKERIILLGAVAGGGDPAAVTAALDPRIAAAVPFNFGGPQPETKYPLPDDAERSFNYAGSGSWESTRNLRLSARDGFLPWVIVGSLAPRRLLYGHEFTWDRERDPVWARLEKIYAWHDANDRLASTHGRGRVTGKPPEASHCNNIGPLQREGIHTTFKRWFGIDPPIKEPRERHSVAELTCLTPALARELKSQPLHILAAALGAERATTARRALAKKKPAEHRQQLRRDWAKLFGTVEPSAEAKVSARDKQRIGDVSLERLTLEVELGIVVPLLLLTPTTTETRPPVVVALAQGGKQVFLKNQATALAELLRAGVAVCLPDVRGAGETRPGDGRGRSSAATAHAASEEMLGETLVGARLRDVRAVLRYLRGRKDVDGGRIALWGESFAPVNPPERNLAMPLDAEPAPHLAEPLGGLLALFAALFEDDIRAVYVHGGLAGYETMLRSPFVYVPADSVVPGALTVGDLNDVTAVLAPRPVRLTGLVDGLNRTLPAEALREMYQPARTAYQSAGAGKQLQIETAALADEPAWRWLLKQLRRP